MFNQFHIFVFLDISIKQGFIYLHIYLLALTLATDLEIFTTQLSASSALVKKRVFSFKNLINLKVDPIRIQ